MEKPTRAFQDHCDYDSRVRPRGAEESRGGSVGCSMTGSAGGRGTKTRLQPPTSGDYWAGLFTMVVGQYLSSGAVVDSPEIVCNA